MAAEVIEPTPAEVEADAAVSFAFGLTPVDHPRKRALAEKMLTTAAAWFVVTDGREETADLFRNIAERIVNPEPHGTA